MSRSISRINTLQACTHILILTAVRQLAVLQMCAPLIHVAAQASVQCPVRDYLDAAVCPHLTRQKWTCTG